MLFLQKKLNDSRVVGVKRFYLLTQTELTDRPTRRYFNKLLLPLLIVLFLGLHNKVNAQPITPIFPVGNTNASISAQMRFLSEYPIDDISDGMQTSPIAYNNEGNKIAPYFYVVPSEYLIKAMSGYSEMKRYSISCKSFFDYETNTIVIAPTQPYSYNTSYSVVFNNFPLLKPDINVDIGYIKITANAVFEDYFRTILPPVAISDISFIRSGNVVWNVNEDIVVHFSKPIAPNPAILDSMFSVIKVGEATKNIDGSISYDYIYITTNATLSADGKSVTISHIEPFEYGTSYFFNVDWEKYLADDYYNGSYSFAVPGEFIVDIKTHFPNNILPEGEFRYKGYDGQKLYYPEDTIRISFPAIYKDYYLSEWRLPETTVCSLSNYGERLELILDAEHYFSNAMGNSAFNDIKRTGITIDVRYELIPIDTLYINFDIDSAVSAIFPNYAKHITIEGAEKINDTTYTYKRYSEIPSTISYDFNDTLIPSFYDDSLGEFVQSNSMALAPALPFPAGKIAIPLGPLNPVNPGGTIITIKLDIPETDPATACEMGNFRVQLHYMGFNEYRAFENDLTGIPRNIVGSVVLRDSQGNEYEPLFEDSAAVSSTKLSQPVSIQNYNSDPTKPVEAGYTITLNNSDYEIFLVTTQHGPNRCTVIGSDVKKADYKDNNIYNNYSLVSESSVSGNIYTRNYTMCDNTLKVYIRRKVVEFAFDVFNREYKGIGMIDTHRVPNLAYFRLEFYDLPPISTIKRKDYLPKTNYPYRWHVNNVGYNYDYNWYEFVGIDKSVADYTYHRRAGEFFGGVTNPNDREYVSLECVSVFYYSGESFSYRPYFKDYCGYKLKSITLPQAANYTQDADNTFRIENFKNPDKVQGGTEKGFVLEYIEVAKKRYNGDVDVPGCTPITGVYMMQKYVVDDAHHTDLGYPLWNNAVLSDYDNGLFLNQESVAFNTLHTHTLRLKFKFNKEYSDASVIDNISVYDFIGHDGFYKELRPDSNELSDYPIIFDRFGFSGQIGNADYGNRTGELSLSLINMNKTPNKHHNLHVMCNLQPFNIDITNPIANPIVTTDLIPGVPIDTLSNIPMDRHRRFKASTIPPGASVDIESFNNINLVDGGFYGTEVEPYIHLLKELNLVGEANPLDGVNPTRDSAGRITFKVDMKRFPNIGHYDMDTNTNRSVIVQELLDMSALDYLRSDQRILYSFHWTEDDQIGSCDTILDVLTETAKLVAKIAGIDDEDKIIDSTSDIFKTLLCEGIINKDDYLGHNDFWLAKSERGVKQNRNRWLSLERWCSDNPNLSLDDYMKEFEQDWNLWGVGKYGMYEVVYRYAYNMEFKPTEVTADSCSYCHLLLYGGRYGYQIVNTFTPNFSTKIRIMTGDR